MLLSGVHLCHQLRPQKKKLSVFSFISSLLSTSIMHQVLTEAATAITMDTKSTGTNMAATAVPGQCGSKRKADFDDDEEEDEISLSAATNSDDVDGDDANPEMSKKKRERRLAMNRSSARARRKRKSRVMQLRAS